jgi:hypothetical protein
MVLSGLHSKRRKLLKDTATFKLKSLPWQGFPKMAGCEIGEIVDVQTRNTAGRA